MPGGHLPSARRAGPACRAEPLIFLRYHGLDLDLRNRAVAPNEHRFDVTAHRQPATMQMPDIAGLNLWTSYDGRSTWTKAVVRALDGGRFGITAIHPPASQRSSDVVTLRAEAWDTAGNRVNQVIPDAFRLIDQPIVSERPSAGISAS